ncbi:MAG TPA: cupredoxin domain-containing protein [Solirubrobacterales bacterium]|nr:cupredoxin domain-containing protein [Solirubrobacterales bacterium]
MNRKRLLSLAAGALALALVVGLTACGSDDEAPAGAEAISFKLTDAGCEPHDAQAAAGPIAFEIENAGTTKVTEMEIMDGDKVLGEEENITDGLDGSFSATLEAGRYMIYCPGGSDERGTLTVTGAKRVEGATKGENDADEGK